MASSTLSQLTERYCCHMMALVKRRNTVAMSGKHFSRKVQTIGGGKAYQRLLRLHSKAKRTVSGYRVP